MVSKRPSELDGMRLWFCMSNVKGYIVKGHMCCEFVWYNCSLLTVPSLQTVTYFDHICAAVVNKPWLKGWKQRAGCDYNSAVVRILPVCYMITGPEPGSSGPMLHGFWPLRLISCSGPRGPGPDTMRNTGISYMSHNMQNWVAEQLTVKCTHGKREGMSHAFRWIKECCTFVNIHRDCL